MSIMDELKEVTLSKSALTSLKNDLIDFYSLGRALEQCSTPEDVLPLLAAELQTRARASTISRLYGRWRKLLPARDLPRLYEEANINGKA